MGAGKGRIQLHFGWQAWKLAATGVVGMIPWCALIMMPLIAFTGPEGDRSTLSPILIPAAVIVLLVLPWLVPWRVLCARQPEGASIRWTKKRVVEWDGPWKRAEVNWRDARAAVVSWVALWHQVLGISRTCRALQLVDARTGATITAWESEPPGAGVVRRRLCAKNLQRLLDAIEEHGVPISGNADWSLAEDPDRKRRTSILVLGRLGYPCVVLAVLFPIPALSIAAGCVAALLLSVRALPAWRELRIVQARVRALSAPESEPTQDADAYRQPAPASAPADDTLRVAADRLRLRAIRAEVFVRSALVALTFVAVVTNVVVLRRASHRNNPTLHSASRL